MSYHRACGGKDDGKPSNTEGQTRVEGKLHIFLFYSKDDLWVVSLGYR